MHEILLVALGGPTFSSTAYTRDEYANNLQAPVLPSNLHSSMQGDFTLMRQAPVVIEGGQVTAAHELY